MSVSTTSWKFVALQTAPANPQMEKDFLTLAASLAVKSSHPGREEIDRIARLHQCPHCPVLGFQDFPEQGFGGAVQLPGEGNARAVLLGTREFLATAGLDVPALLEVAARRWTDEGAVVVFGGWDGYVRGLLKFQRQ